MHKRKNVYFDYGATTPVDPTVIDALLPYFAESFGNPASVHSIGQQTEAVVERSRESIAKLINCNPDEIIFTSCGSESDNLALRGTAFSRRMERQAKHILISPVEHHAVFNTAKQLQDLHGFEVEELPVDAYGRVRPQDVSEMIRPDTAIVSVIFANNEVGTINPIADIGAVCQGRDVPFHTDAVQAAAHMSIDVKAMNIDLMAIGAHKFYGPKGVGFLYKRQGVSMLPIQTGGGQEGDYRSGTLNVPLIVGMAKALEISDEEQHKRSIHNTTLRNQLIETILEEVPEVQLTGHPNNRLANHASFAFKGVDGNMLMMMLDAAGFSCSSGSACKTGNPEPSEVLSALGLTHEWALGSLRITTSHHNSTQEVDELLSILPEIIAKCRIVVKV